MFTRTLEEVQVNNHTLPDLEVGFSVDEDGAKIEEIYYSGMDCTEWFEARPNFYASVERHCEKFDVYRKVEEDAGEDIRASRYDRD
jgi:hypothetical protein